MKRSQIIAAAGAIAALVLLVLTLRQVSALRDEVAGLRNRLFQMEQSLTDEINGIDNDIRRELETQGSLFSASDTTLDYRDGALVLTASVLPKEVGADETLTLSACGVSAPMEPGADGVYTGELTLPLAKEISPAVSFTSPAGTRQETLDSLWRGDSLTVEGESLYETGEDGSVAVYVGLNPYGSGPVEGRADVESLTLLVTDGDTGEDLGTVELEPVVPPDNPPAVIPDVDDGSATEAAPTFNTNLLWYSADISGYMPPDGYDLEFWAVLITDGGLVLTDINPVVTLAGQNDSSHGSYGDISLSPDWEE